MKTLLLRVASAMLLTLCVCAPVRAAGIDPATVPPREAAPNDASAYRRFVLPNGMKVLLLSDPKLNVASASVAVGVGNLADPPQRQGLAHYLEHMLFLGTEKYPSVEDFGEYLERNGGSNNAYTAREQVAEAAPNSAAAAEIQADAQQLVRALDRSGRTREACDRLRQAQETHDVAAPDEALLQRCQTEFRTRLRDDVRIAPQLQRRSIEVTPRITPTPTP